MKYLTVLLIPAIFSAGCKPANASLPGDKTAPLPVPTGVTVQTAAPKTAKEVKTAYGTAEFGMSFDQVAALPQFKEWFLDKNTPAISNYEEKIGSETYRVTFFFYRDKLYRVDFTTAEDLYKPVERYETDIRREVVNLRDFFSRTYGAPDTDNGMPRSTGLTRGYVIFVYKWRVGGKTITIGISESREGGGYKTVAQFYDTADYQAARAEN